ncbi:hydrogenase maturation factor HybG [Actinobacillus pleuropneumoniae]|uniref:Hydrogenase-2 operon protein HybG n=1 Tax=Actinobacillus pleuropneumoniae serotype 5b (strain L20) TaxID=416269 RepID=A3N1Y5_ACTP2|nr:hydrogenase maturation factor HybG [Actinobacillus pleuropneumoniae]ABN74421.1 hydrogenase-2 operon protein HybG [Actinobacillus pleuropneumoniae serovar 5b str. L20]
MCLGVPGKIVKIGQSAFELATVDVCGVQREVNITLICDRDPQELLGKWVLIHVGFAMSIMNEQEAKDTLDALLSINQLEHELTDFEGLRPAS